MNTLKRWLGVAWMALAIAAFVFLVRAAASNIKLDGKLDINKPLPWVIIIAVFLPVAAGLCLFGYYAMKGEYDGRE